MTDDTPERIRELQLKISQWTSEQDHSIQQLRDDLEQRRAALSLSSKVVTYGSIPSVLLILYGSAIALAKDFSIQQFSFCLGELGLLAIMAAAAARASGLWAHWWFRRSFIHERTATVMISLMAVTLLFLWVVWYSEDLWPNAAIQ